MQAIQSRPISQPPLYITNTQPIQTTVQPPLTVNTHNPNNDIERPFVFQPGQRLNDKYEVVGLIGRGTFSTVLHCRLLDSNRQRHDSIINQGRGAHLAAQCCVAVKIVRDVERYRRAAEREITLLDWLRSCVRNTPPNIINQQSMNGYYNAYNDGRHGLIELLDAFIYDSRYVCMVFPLYGLSLYDFLYYNRFLPLFPHHIKHIAQQLITTIAYLHDLHIVHADIKPENILLIDSAHQTIQIEHLTVNVPLNTTVKLIDFGTAVMDNTTQKPKIVASRSYRSIEVVLDIGWSYGVDIWSAGCVLMELYSGTRLFNLHSTCSDNEHITMMESILGPIPNWMKKQSRLFNTMDIQPSPQPILHDINQRASKYNQYMDNSNNDLLLNNDSNNIPLVPGQTSPYMRNRQSLTQSPSQHNLLQQQLNIPKLRDRVVATDELFYDLISQMLRYEPAQRITAKQALRHPYFNS